MQVFAVAQILSLVSAAQTRLALHALGLFTNLAALNMKIAGSAVQQLTGMAQGPMISSNYQEFADEAVATIRKSWDASSLAARALASDLEEIKAGISELIQSNDGDQLHKRRWRVKI